MFELPCSIGVRMDVGDFLEFQGTLQGHCIIKVAPNKEYILRIEMLGSQILDVFPILKDLFNFIRQSLQLCEIGCIFFGGKAPQQIRHVNGQQVYDSQLCTVRLCRRYRDFRASPCIDHIVGLVCDGAPHHVDDRKSSRAQALCLTHGSQCIGGFPGLADHQHQHLFVDDRLPVTEFGCFSSDGRANGVKKVNETEAELGDPALDELLTPYLHQQLADEIELLDGAAEEFDLDKVLRGELSPVFFGSALTNFGVEPFLENFLRLTPTPLARVDSLTGESVDPCRDEFSAFIFKIQANMNKAHRDRIAFMRICSGKFERGMEAYHVQEGKNIKLATGTQLMAQDRAIVDEAYAGDIIGLFDPGIFSIGDTLCTGKKKVQFAGIPTFSPEHFARIEQKDTMKRKQFVKGMEQIAQEGAIQIFREVGGGMEEVVVGVVGVLQLEVLEYRLNTEYNVEIRMQQLPFEQLRWVKNDPDTYNLRDLDLTSDTKAVEDMKGNRLLLFTSDWAVRWAETHNESLQLSEFGNI